MKTTRASEKILVVDDDADFGKLATIYLETCGFTVRTVGNGLDAVALIRKERVDLVLTEWVLPMLDGEKFLNWLRKEEASDIPVLVLTAVMKTKGKQKILDAGANEVMYKPISGARLLDRLETLLIRKRE